MRSAALLLVRERRTSVLSFKNHRPFLLEGAGLNYCRLIETVALVGAPLSLQSSSQRTLKVWESFTDPLCFSARPACYREQLERGGGLERAWGKWREKKSEQRGRRKEVLVYKGEKWNIHGAPGT
ncbi:hypothetical protein AAFF_G00208240 [Aldrovandia affinis]|uniref:Uncharacterized protein n=1 Tax=Aldrovandia affinis TaxID=143900 RepID=A0AAD7RHE4_9TELE|nr:hypothetical protein AAFF_G00208240 [Aldrovandia affinis]